MIFYLPKLTEGSRIELYEYSARANLNSLTKERRQPEKIALYNIFDESHPTLVFLKSRVTFRRLLRKTEKNGETWNSSFEISKSSRR